MIQDALREQSTVPHQQLEKIVISRLKAIKTDKDYAEFLTLFYSYFNKLEQAIAPFITDEMLPDRLERRNSSYLANDIIDLGENPVQLTGIELPVIDNAAKAFGALYVMEGSIMGGPIIIQILAKYGVTKGISFFSGYGPETGKKWNAFIDALNTNLSAKHHPDAINAAVETFSRFADAFELAARPH